MSASNRLPAPPLKVFLVVGEESGDQLGASLMKALRQAYSGPVLFQGTGGVRMAGEGLVPLFPLEDIAVMGVSAVIRRLPLILRRIRDTVRAARDARPDAMVLIDSPDFTHRVARRVRGHLPGLKVVNYVPPSVWAWRPGRARRMRAYVDHALGILPFEPATLARLGGPSCTYVGHPLIERLDVLRGPRDLEIPNVLGIHGDELPDAPQVLVLPGSRSTEIDRLLTPFGETVARIAAACPEARFVLPAVSHLADRIAAEIEHWPVRPRIVVGEAEKFAAFRQARAALAASGTVSLELALAGVPMTISYKLEWLFRRIKDLHPYLPLVRARSIVLANLVIDENVVPEFLEEAVEPERLARKTLELMADTPARQRQLAGFAKLDVAMRLPPGETPSMRAARAVLDTVWGTANGKSSYPSAPRHGGA